MACYRQSESTELDFETYTPWLQVEAQLGLKFIEKDRDVVHGEIICMMQVDYGLLWLSFLELTSPVAQLGVMIPLAAILAWPLLYDEARCWSLPSRRLYLAYCWLVRMRRQLEESRFMRLSSSEQKTVASRGSYMLTYSSSRKVVVLPQCTSPGVFPSRFNM